MSRLVRTLAWVLVGILAVAPLSATVYKVTLKNGNVFETRYQPEDASWDAGKIVLLDEMGNLIALSKDDVQEVLSDIEAKGYGTVIDNTTMYLGWAPNEGEEGTAEGAAAAAAQATGQEEPNLTYNQFVEPDQTQGMPGEWVAYPSSGQRGAGVYNQNAPGGPGGGPYLTPPYVQPNNPAAGTPAPEAPAPPPSGTEK